MFLLEKWNNHLSKQIIHLSDGLINLFLSGFIQNVPFSVQRAVGEQKDFYEKSVCQQV